MNKFIAILFACSCFLTSYMSANILGIGMWFWIIIITGVFVAASQFHKSLITLGSIAAILLGVISILAILLGLLAATIGGSFRLNNQEAILLFSFFLIAVFGFTLIIANRNQR